MSTQTRVKPMLRRVVLGATSQTVRLAIVSRPHTHIQAELLELARELGCVDCLMELES